MLIEFKVTNFRSIREAQTLSMVASNYSNELPQNLIAPELPGLADMKLLKAVALYGANASGKSSIVAALRFVSQFVRDSATTRKPDQPIGVRFNQSSGDNFFHPSCFEVTAVISGIRMTYGIEIDFLRVRKEYLVAYPKGRAQMWFEREWNGKTYRWSSRSSGFRHDAPLRDSVRPNASFISAAAQLNHEQATKVWSWFANQVMFLDLANEPIDWKVALLQLGDPSAKARFVRALANADVGVTDIVLRPSFSQVMKRVEAMGVDRKSDPDKYAQIFMEAWQQPPAQDEEAEPTLVHRGIGGETFALDFDSDESAGTRRFFSLLGYWFSKIDAGGVLVIDEIETSMHPLLVQALLRAFFGSDQSRQSAQLIFTTHNPLLLDQTLLRRDQVWFTEKEKEGATRLYPLTDYQPRKDESLIRGYLGGRYGGVPFIPHGLMANDGKT